MPRPLSAFAPWAILDRVVVCPGNLDCVSTDANAWNDADGEVKACRGKRVVMTLATVWLGLGAGIAARSVTAAR